MAVIERVMIVVAFLLLVTAGSANAQPPLLTPPAGGNPGGDRQLLDGVAAVVGGEVILISEVYAQATQLARQGQTDANNPENLREVLNAMIDEKLVLARAREDSVEVRDDDLARLVEQQYQTILERCQNSEDCLEKTYGMPPAKIRRELTDLLRQQYLVNEVRRRRFSALRVTENDVQEFLSIYSDSLGEVPEQVELQRIVLIAKPSSEARQQAFALAARIVDSLRAGGDFAEFATRYSSDPGSAAKGGDVGFVEAGRFVKEYEQAAAKLGINEISDPVESQFGIHIIQLLERRDNATHSRHILLPILADSNAKWVLQANLKLIRDSAIAGEDFSELARRNSEDPDTRGLGGSLGKIPVERIPDAQKTMIAAMNVGDITEPSPIALSPSESGYQIIRLARRIPKHQANLAEDRAQIEEIVLRYEQSKEYEKWVQGLRDEIYWDIKYRF